MNKYLVAITETLTTTIEVNACDAAAALETVTRAYLDEVYVLDASHHTDTDFTIIKEVPIEECDNEDLANYN